MPIKSSVSDIVERRNESRKWYQLNYWDEYEEAFRASKCLTKPITRKNAKGQEEEDKSRTNVAMPELALIRRRKVARLTAQAPQIKYTGVNQQVADKLSMLAAMQFDRSGEKIEHRRVVDSCVTFGRGISKVFPDTIEVSRQLKRDRMTMMQEDPEGYRRMAADEVIPGLEQPTTASESASYSDEDISNALAERGDIIQGSVPVVKYEGPVVKSIFIGDFFDEPGCRSLNESGFVVENYSETDLWIQKMLRKRYIDPETGEERPVFDQKACEDLLTLGTWNPNQGSQQPYDLRTRLRTFVQNQTVPMFPTRLLPGKRFDILECHERDQYGKMWISWVGNEKIKLGSMPYPYDLYGKYSYTEMVVLPDMINAVGDSQLRLLRFLWALHNAAVGSRRDLVNQILRPLLGVKIGANIPDEAFERSLFRVIQSNPGDLFPIIENISGIGQAIQSANEEEAQALRMIGMAEPNMTSVDVGTDANPMAGKLATTAILGAKAADALTQFEIDGVELYLKELGEKKLWINQQIQEDPWQLDAKYGEKLEGFSERYGHAVGITLDPMEMQEDIQVEPVAGSMLAVDDEFKRNAAMQMYTLALQNPADWNTKYCAEVVAGTIRGVDASKAINQNPPQQAPPKLNISLAVKYPELPSEAQANLLKEAGIISEAGAEEIELGKKMDGLVKADEAGTALANLSDTAVSEQEQRQNDRESAMASKVNKQVAGK